MCGSCFGAITWASSLMSRANFFKGNDAESRGDFVQAWSFAAISFSWAAVFYVTYAVEFLCLSAAKLMVLDRMSTYAAGQDEGSRKRWAAGGRMVMAVVVLGNSIGLAGNIAAAVHAQRAAEAASTASALFAANSTQAAREHASSSRTEMQLAISITAVQMFCEVAVLLLIVAAFVVAGIFCARLISIFMKRAIRYTGDVEAALAIQEAGKKQMLQQLGTTVFVFVAFVIRSVQSTLFAVSRQLQDGGTSCPGVTSRCDSSCTNVFTHIHQWMVYTPEFQLTVVLVASPLALLVALWGVTSSLALQLMTPGNRELAIVQQDVLVLERARR